MRAGHRGSGLSRRAAVTGAAVAASLHGLARAQDTRRLAGGFDPALSVGSEELGRWLARLHAFGPIRPTGTGAARDFEEWLAVEVVRLGFRLERIPYRLTSWTCDLERDCQLRLQPDEGSARDLPVVAYYPFAASTRGLGPVSGRVIHAGVGDAAVRALVARVSPGVLANSVVVVDMPLAGGGARETPRVRPDTFPPGLPAPPGGPNPATQGGRAAMEAVEGKCRALVLAYTDVSDEAARYNWLPFSDKHRRTPALWVGREGADALRAASGKGSLAVRCDAVLTPDARADTLVATLPGPSDEVVFLTTQTDGPNECNENGGLGVLALARYWARTRSARRRTLVAAFPTGHYAAGAIADPVTGSGRAAGTRGVFDRRPDLQARIVGQIALEQMGAREWSAADLGWRATGQPAPDMWIPTPRSADVMARLFHASAQGSDSRFDRAYLVEGGMAPGEGGYPRGLGLPGIGLMGTPQYFFRADPKGVLDKLDPQIMRTQVEIATRMMLLMDRLSPAQLRGEAPVSDTDLFG